MEDKKKIFIIGGVVLAIISSIIFVVILLFGNNSSLTREGSLIWWGYEEKNEGIDLLIEKYTEKNKKVTIEYSQRGETPEEYERILNDALASNNGPDIFSIRNDWTPKHYNKLASVPSSIYSNEEFKEIFYEVAYEDLSEDDALYALPLTLDTLAVLYNKKMAGYNQPGETWDEFKESVKKYRKLEGDYIKIAGTALGTSNNIEYSEDILYMIMLQNHTTMVSDDYSQAYFNLSAKDKYGNLTYPGTSALSFYTSFSDLNKETYTWRKEMGNSFALFTDSKVAAIFGYAKDLKRIEEATNDSLSFEVVKAPQVLGNELYIAKYWAPGVSKDSSQKDLAWSFLEFATSKSNASGYANKVELPSARKDVAEKQGGKNIKVFISQLENATSWHKGDWLKTDKLFNDLISTVAVKKQKAQAAIDDTAKAMNNILKELDN